MSTFVGYQGIRIRDAFYQFETVDFLACALVCHPGRMVSQGLRKQAAALQKGASRAAAPADADPSQGACAAIVLTRPSMIKEMHRWVHGYVDALPEMLC